MKESGISHRLDLPVASAPAAPVAIVAGSGISLEPLFDRTGQRVPFDSIAGLRCGSIPGHAYEFVHGECVGRPLILQRGRLHFYEGFAFETIVRTVEVLHGWGVRTLLITAAAGGLRPGIEPGDLVGIERLRLCRYVKWNATPGMLFPDFVLPDCDFFGAYQWVHGPTYETRAEIAAIQSLKADTIGMSSAPEVLRCHELGIQAGLVACVTNSCCRPARLAHADVLAAARTASARLVRVIRKWMESSDRDCTGDK